VLLAGVSDAAGSLSFRFKSLAQKFVGKRPTEILDFSVIQSGRMSDIRRLALSRKCMLTISVPFVAFF
jgi:hypothetical protein